MSKVERLNARMAKLLRVVVREVLEVVRETEEEYQDKTARTQRENESLKRKLRDLQDRLQRHNPGSVMVTVPAEEEGIRGDFIWKREEPLEDDIKPISSDNEITVMLSAEPHQDLYSHVSDPLGLKGSSTGLAYSAADGFNRTCQTEKQLVRVIIDAVDPDTKLSPGALDIALSQPTPPNHLSLPEPAPPPNHLSLPEPAPPPNHLSLPEPAPPPNHLSPNSSYLVSDQPLLTIDDIKTEPGLMTEFTAQSIPRHFNYSGSGHSRLGHQDPRPAENSGSQFSPPARAGSREQIAVGTIASLEGGADHSNRNNEYHQQQHNILERRKTFGAGAGSLRIFQQQLGREKRFCCPFCDRSFSHAEHFAKHKRVHMGEKPYCCMACGKRFRQSSTLKIHQRCHSAERLYGCTVCGKRFSQSGTLKIHQRCHTAERPYSCTVCGKDFSDPSSFYRHKKVHTGEKPYCCTLCGKRFSDASNFARHNKKVHTGMKPF